MKFCRWIMIIMMMATWACGQPAETADTVKRTPIVKVIRPQRSDMVDTIDLPGDLVGIYEAALHSKVTGYLQSISVDKGDWVRKGQVLAQIEVPELHSNLARAQATLKIAEITYDRLRRVQQSDPRLVSQQDVDMAFARYQEAQAGAHTLETMIGYTQVIAPFDGVITGRFADPGALIRAGGGDFGIDETSGLISPGATEGAGGHRSGGGPILTIADIDQMRVYVYVPENAYPLIRRGTPAKLHFAEFPNRVFRGTVARFATALDLATRTMLTEVDIDNPNRVLYPRSYAHVTLDLIRHTDVLNVPSAAIQGNGASARVLVVKGSHLDEVPVSTGLSEGDRVEITSGLTDDSLVVGMYSSALTPGERVRFSLSSVAHEPDSHADNDEPARIASKSARPNS
jgi:multidrug efflux pump subunit AcrA (membrane-fusion protein)